MGAAAGGAARPAAPVLRWPGSKWRVAGWIVAHLPRHDVYLEPYFGSGAVFFRKPPSRVETVNDLSGDVVNLFRVIRARGDELAAAVEMTPWARAEWDASAAVCDDDLERARRFLVRCWQAYGSRERDRQTWKREVRAGGDVLVTSRWRRLPARIVATALRLREAQIECAPALDLIERHRDGETLIYADPPYLPSVRTRGAQYRHEMGEVDHVALLAALRAHPGPVLLSGYDSPLYADVLTDWRHVARRGPIEGGGSRLESLWINPLARERLGQLALPLMAGG
jgi:DNA adenine methylase